MSHELKDLIGKVAQEIKCVEGDDEVVIKFTDGSKLQLYHDYDCCESFWLDDIVGDPNDLIGNPLLLCEEASNIGEDKFGSSQTWTFYKFATIKGYLDLKFIGESNGYYSEDCSISITMGDK